MIGVAAWQAVLNGIGEVLAFLYGLVPNYGVAIILLTVLIRVLLLPLGIKQIRSMQAMQRIQPKVKAMQQKHKGNRQRLNEEMMKLYREEGVNPLAGCLPLIAQLPVLFALFTVLRFPQGLTHIPEDSRLHQDILAEEAHFIPGMNMLCNALQAGQTVPVDVGENKDLPDTLHCGDGIPVRIPYYFLALAMVGTTWFQQRQMQRASPPGAAQSQQQAIMRVMPLLFGVWGFFFPAGLVLYWTTTNTVQIGQQAYMLSRGHIGSGADAASPDGEAGDGGKRGRRGGRAARRSDQRPGREPGGKQARPTSVRPTRRRSGAAGGDGSKGSGGGEGGDDRPSRPRQRDRGPGGRHGGNRKKRRKR
jgi:YidC/Oxa1 family membrane protein insertase